jgi:hypothetical protein
MLQPMDTDFVRGMHDWPYSFMIRIALTGSIGPRSCHLSSRSRDHHFVATAMVAFDNPALHQNGMAVGVANCLGTAANRLGEQTTRTTVAVTAMLGLYP